MTRVVTVRRLGIGRWERPHRRQQRRVVAWLAANGVDPSGVADVGCLAADGELTYVAFVLDVHGRRQVPHWGAGYLKEARTVLLRVPPERFGL